MMMMDATSAGIERCRKKPCASCVFRVEKSVLDKRINIDIRMGYVLYLGGESNI